jgi:peptidoglycan hydrolase CwlO-like protein
VKKILTRIADRLDALEAQGDRLEQGQARIERQLEQLQSILVETHTFARDLHSRLVEHADRAGHESREHDRRLTLLEGSGSGANGGGGE